MLLLQKLTALNPENEMNNMLLTVYKCKLYAVIYI